MSFIDKMIYDSLGNTGNTYYNIFVNKRTGETWNWVTETMDADPSRPDSAVLLGEVGTSGKFPIIVPTNLPKGILFDVVVYLQAGTPAANTDDLETSYSFQHGSIFGF